MSGKNILNIKKDINNFKLAYEEASTVQKRSISRAIKALTKEIKKITYSSSEKASKKQSTDFTKTLLQAGETYNIERTKGVEINKKEKIRERKKGEHGKALQAFKIVYFHDNFNYKKAEKVHDIIIYITVPNYPVIKQYIENELRNQIQNNNSKNKLSGYITIKYYMITGRHKTTNEEIRDNRYFNSKIQSLTSSHILLNYINNLIVEFEKELDEARNGTGFTFDGIEKLSIKTAKSKAIIGGSYIPLPDFVKNIQACINIKNTDEKCFLWSLLTYKFYKTFKKGCGLKATEYKKYINEIKEPEGVIYPLEIDFIPEFERLNDLKINVFQINENNKIGILYQSYEKYKDVVNLLWFQVDNNAHYVWIKDINRLDAHNVATHASMYRCSYCNSARFMTKESLFKHIETCREDKLCGEILPEEGKNILQFKNVGNKFKHPFHVVADFESTLLKIDDGDNKTKKYQKHIPNSYGLKYNCIHDVYSKPVEIFNSPDPEEVRKHFIERLEELAKYSHDLTQTNKTQIKSTAEQKQSHKLQMQCQECNCQLSNEKEKDGKINPFLKVRHHDHITGEFISLYVIIVIFNFNTKNSYLFIFII